MSEYEKLQSVVVCDPSFISITEVINETQKKYAKEGIKRARAVEQHQEFVSALIDHGANVLKLPADARFPEQVFTRDIGFAIGETLIVSTMAEPVRQGEEQYFAEWVEKREFAKVIQCPFSIEGGDVLVDGDRVFVGISGRTRMEAVEFLRQQLPTFQFIPIPVPKKFLHLDCIFNIISPTEALIFPEAFGKKELFLLGQYYSLLPVEADEHFTMGVNVLSVGKRKIVSLPENKKLNCKLKNRGYEVIEVEFSEIIKSGGSFRCCTMPVRRG